MDAMNEKHAVRDECRQRYNESQAVIRAKLMKLIKPRNGVVVSWYYTDGTGTRCDEAHAQYERAYVRYYVTMYVRYWYDVCYRRWRHDDNGTSNPRV